ncbi:MAG TPA: Mur ligase family protein, partial [Motiliproteus sp.]
MIGRWRLSELSTPLSALQCQGEAEFNRVSTDTRRLLPGDLFVALSGPNFDANRFVAQAAAQGAVAAVVSELQPVDLPQLLVADTRLALGQLGALNRARSEAALVAVTGSSGKTSVKEMLAEILRGCGRVHATQGNLNNEIGVPLTLLA